MSRKERHSHGITREIRNFSENNYFKIIIFVSNNFVSAGRFVPLSWETYFYTVVVLNFWKSLLQNFQSQRQWCIKILLPWAQKFYTPLVLGKGSKCPWQFFVPAVVVYKILSPISAPCLKGHLFEHPQQSCCVVCVCVTKSCGSETAKTDKVSASSAAQAAC